MAAHPVIAHPMIVYPRLAIPDCLSKIVYPWLSVPLRDMPALRLAHGSQSSVRCPAIQYVVLMPVLMLMLMLMLMLVLVLETAARRGRACRRL